MRIVQTCTLGALALAVPVDGALSSSGAPIDESTEAFAQELERVRYKMERGAWDVALRRLQLSLESHAGQG